jgi:hypothetical protein
MGRDVRLVQGRGMNHSANAYQVVPHEFAITH